MLKLKFVGVFFPPPPPYSPLFSLYSFIILGFWKCWFFFLFVQCRLLFLKLGRFLVDSMFEHFSGRLNRVKIWINMHCKHNLIWNMGRCIRSICTHHFKKKRRKKKLSTIFLSKDSIYGYDDTTIWISFYLTIQHIWWMNRNSTVWHHFNHISDPFSSAIDDST